jgi:3-isopropylmalate/(R)-2-methylmalate dehydratase small subunit
VQNHITGRVWKFGDDVSTDVMLPGSIEFAVAAGRIPPAETVPYCMAAIRPGWHREVRAGDVLVAGRNFGAGSARPAYVPLRAMGVQAVVAESPARLFYRNSINAGFLVVDCPGVTGIVEEGEELEIDLADGVVRNIRTNQALHFPPLDTASPPMQVLRAGGLIPYLKVRLGLDDGEQQ